MGHASAITSAIAAFLVSASAPTQSASYSKFIIYAVTNTDSALADVSDYFTDLGLTPVLPSHWFAKDISKSECCYSYVVVFLPWAFDQVNLRLSSILLANRQCKICPKLLPLQLLNVLDGSASGTTSTCARTSTPPAAHFTNKATCPITVTRTLSPYAPMQAPLPQLHNQQQCHRLHHQVRHRPLRH